MGDGNVRIPESLVVVVIPQSLARRHHDVFVHDASSEQVDFAPQCLLFRPVDPFECVARQARQFVDSDDQVNLVVADLGQLDGNVFEEVLRPEVANGPGDFLSWDGQLLADLQRTEQLDRLGIGVIRPKDGQTGKGVFLVVIRRGRNLSPRHLCRTHHEQGAAKQQGSHHGFSGLLHFDSTLWLVSNKPPNRRSLFWKSRMAPMNSSLPKSGHSTGEK